MRVYFAGAIGYLTYDEAVAWREYAFDWLAGYGIEGFSPMRGKEHLKDKGILTPYAYGEHPITSAKGVLTKDRFDVQRSDLVLMNLLETKEISVGSMIEVGWADAYRKPLIVCMEEGNIHEHCMVEAATGFRFDNLEDGLVMCKTLLLPY